MFQKVQFVSGILLRSLFETQSRTNKMNKPEQKQLLETLNHNTLIQKLQYNISIYIYIF